MTTSTIVASKSQLELDLEKFAVGQQILGNKGPLAVVLVVNRMTKGMSVPYKPEELVTSKQGQVKGLGKAATQAVLASHRISRVLAEEGGRTSRGSMLIMQSYLAFLNKQILDNGSVDLDECERFWIEKAKEHFDSKPFILKFDPAWGVRMSVRNLALQAIARQKEASGTMFLGTMMQHLVGAKLDVILGAGILSHHSANTSDQKADRHGDFDLEDVAIHVSTAPTEALVRKCKENLGKGKRPIIITIAKGMNTADGLLETAGILDRVDLIEFEQFIATNVFELGRFTTDGRKATFESIVYAYNTIIKNHETDPGLRIEITSGK